MNRGAIILCGGESSRMGQDKAMLPFGPERMLQRVVRLIGEVVERQDIVVVAAPQQQLPNLPKELRVVRDEQPFLGPLQGLATGLRAVGDRCEAAFVTGCDTPLLRPAYVALMFERLGDAELAVPFDGQHHYPLSAVYRTTVLPHIEQLLAENYRAPRDLIGSVATREVSPNELRIVDPELISLTNVNSPAEYRDALQLAGLSGD